MRVNVISETKQEYNGTVYYKCGCYFQRKGERLHRIVWEKENGRKVPKGLHVHHIDGDRSNNQPSNLTLIRRYDHLSLHGKEHSKESGERANRIRHLAAAWHGSEEGRKWHSQNAKKQWENRKPVTYQCSYCGKEFQSINRFAEGANHFCGNNCKSAYRRSLGIDNVQRRCLYCGNEYTVNKYNKKQKYCSTECVKNARYGTNSKVG